MLRCVEAALFLVSSVTCCVCVPVAVYKRAAASLLTCDEPAQDASIGRVGGQACRFPCLSYIDLAGFATLTDRGVSCALSVRRAANRALSSCLLAWLSQFLTVQQCPFLEELVLDGCFWVTDISMMTVGSRCADCHCGGCGALCCCTKCASIVI